MRFKNITNGTFDAIALEDIRVHLKIPSNVTAEDNLLISYIKSAGRYFENFTNRVISSSTWAGYLNEWPSSMLIRIKKNPITSVTKI
jgi:uncharacterized phiE125 gp8 family phage protein